MTRPHREIIDRVETREAEEAELRVTGIKAGFTFSREHPEERHLTIKVRLHPDAPINASVFILDLGGLLKDGGIDPDGIDPYQVAADLMAAGDALLRLASIEAGLDAKGVEVVTRRVVKRRRRKAEQERREIAAQLQTVATCSRCGRPTALIENGVRYCKRHAEQAGLRQKGKI